MPFILGIKATTYCGEEFKFKQIAAKKKTRKGSRERKEMDTGAGERRAEKEGFVDRIISWKIFQLAKANKNQACCFHTYIIATPSKWQHPASVPSSI